MFGRAQTAAFVASLLTLFLFAALFRFLALSGGFTNDHFLHLAAAQQMLFGEWPTKDFLDYGQPLMFVASALAQLLLGRTLFAEAMLVTAAYATTAVLTALAVRSLTGSRLLAVIAAALEVAIFPRAYGYPKLLFYAAGFLLLQRYVTRPTSGRLIAYAVLVTIAFLFRHDHGVYLGVAGVIAAWLRGASEPTGAVRPAAMLAGCMALLVAPYLVYVHVYDGIWSYVQKGLDFRSSEVTRQALAFPPIGDRPFEAILFYGYWSLPIAAALVLLVWRRRADAPIVAARVAPIIAVAVMMNYSFLRTPFGARLPDAIVPAVTLGAWLTACAWRARRAWVWRPVSALALVVFVAAVLEAGRTTLALDRAGLLGPWERIPRLVRAARLTLVSRHHERQMPSGAADELMPFYYYVERCTTPAHRILALGTIPETLVFTQRPFAGGRTAFVAGYYDSEPYQRDVLARLARQQVPFVLIPGGSYRRDLDRAFPLVAAYVSSRYEPLHTFGTQPEAMVEVLFDRTMAVQARDVVTGWPCLK